MTATPAPDLPDYAALGSDLVETLIARPGWLYVWLTTEADGKSWWSVHRSVQLRDDDEWLQPVRDLVGDGEFLHRETVEDESMMGYRAELSIYAAS